MRLEIEVPDNIVTLSPVAQLDAVMSAAVTVLLKVASDKPSKNAPTAAAALAVAAPFGTDSYGYPFKSQAEADTWKAAVAQRDANLADTSSVPGAVEARADALISLDYGQRTVWFPVTPGQIVEVEALADGALSAATGSGSFFVFLDYVPSIDSDKLVYSSGGGGARLPLKKGQRAFFKFDGPQEQDMRAELL